MDYKIIYQDKLADEYRDKVIEGLDQDAFQKRQIGKDNGAFSFAIVEDDGELIGAVKGNNYYGCGHIDILWIKEQHRNKGYGSMLIEKCEEIMRKRNCLFSTVNTMDFQAREFYERHGFGVEFIRQGLENNTTMYCMRKSLA
jgi:ribosomal protein S18 acetylase RimI-like enzyme